ncbi:MAG: hypothetical protein LBI84_08375 [Propionibacteriaceae bacterium]|nr:hypothetical protein [Propionibacteriaceae bacterium]
MPSSKHPLRRLTGVTTALSVTVVAAMAALVAAWRLGSSIPFYVVLTIVLAAAAYVNLAMLLRRVQRLEEDLSMGEYRSAVTLIWLVVSLVSAVVGVCFTISENIAKYPIIFSTVPVFMLFISGYIGFVEAHVAERKAAMSANSEPQA